MRLRRGSRVLPVGEFGSWKVVHMGIMDMRIFFPRGPSISLSSLSPFPFLQSNLFSGVFLLSFFSFNSLLFFPPISLSL